MTFPDKQAVIDFVERQLGVKVKDARSYYNAFTVNYDTSSVAPQFHFALNKPYIFIGDIELFLEILTIPCTVAGEHWVSVSSWLRTDSIGVTAIRVDLARNYQKLAVGDVRENFLPVRREGVMFNDLFMSFENPSKGFGPSSVNCMLFGWLLYLETNSLQFGGTDVPVNPFENFSS